MDRPSPCPPTYNEQRPLLGQRTVLGPVLSVFACRPPTLAALRARESCALCGVRASSPWLCGRPTSGSSPSPRAGRRATLRRASLDPEASRAGAARRTCVEQWRRGLLGPVGTCLISNRNQLPQLPLLRPCAPGTQRSGEQYRDIRGRESYMPRGGVDTPRRHPHFTPLRAEDSIAWQWPAWWGIGARGVDKFPAINSNSSLCAAGMSVAVAARHSGVLLRTL